MVPYHHPAPPDFLEIPPATFKLFIREMHDRILCQNTPQLIAQEQKKSKQVLDFLQYLFYESESAIKDYRRKKLFQKLHHKMSVAESNYGKLKFPMEDNRMITSNLLRREDY